MCGIAGAVWLSSEQRLEPAKLDQMTDMLRHRGPDGRGTHYQAYPDGSGVGLGHRRLSIIDLEGGKQPLCNEDGTVWVTFNGEIYNYGEVRQELIAAGHLFRTDSDTEVIVHGYEQWGDECLARFRGMFAFAVWDERNRRALLARDRLGKKPLVYHVNDGRLLFASEIKALLVAPNVSREIDPQAIDAFLAYGYVPHPHTIFRSIHKLPPAHYAVFENGRLQTARYWQPDLNAESSLSLEQIRGRIGELLNDAVRYRLRSDVPLGAFLSGGIDSTAVVGLMSRHMSQPVETFTIGFPVDKYDEAPFARIAANHLKSNHHELRVEPASIEILPILAWHFDEPFADSSAIPTYYVSQATRRHVTVALTGDGGDELFAGYMRYRTIESLGAWDSLPAVVRGIVANPLWDWLPASNREKSTLRRARFRMARLRESRAERYSRWVMAYQQEQRHALYHPDFAAQLNGRHPDQFVSRLVAESRRSSAGRQAMNADLQTYLPCDLLAKVDITSMAHGLECRCPFLDERLVEFAVSIPFRHLVAGGGPKPLVTSTFAEFFPDSLKQRPKMGFEVPLDHWFRGPLSELADDFLLSETSLARGYFRREALENLLAEHRSGQWSHGNRLWALICLEAWHRTYIDPAEVPSAPLSDLIVVPVTDGKE